ncbi:MAG: chloride channel protein [Actinobacteria bacterium]|nr:chloride channel protein [Actinomycetota bacterium]
MSAVLRAARRAITSTGSTVVVAVVVAMVFERLVAAARWVVAWPADGDVWWTVVLFAGAVLSMVITQRARADGRTTGAFVRDLDDPPADLRSAPARFAASVTGVGLGTPLGIDGPALHLGGSLAAAAARVLGRRERPWVIAGGVAALSMAIDAPLAAALLVVEVGGRHRHRRADVMPLVVGGGAGWLVQRLVGDPGGIIGRSFRLPATSAIPSGVVLGVVCGLAGGAYAGVLVRRGPARRPLPGRVAAVVGVLGPAVLVGWLATGQPIFVGPGDRTFDWAAGTAALPVAAALAAAAIVVPVPVAADVTGGLVLPVRWLGGMVGVVLALTWLPTSSIPFATVTGGSAMLAATCSTPAAAVALGFAAFGWSAASWGVAVAVLLARVTSSTRWRPLVCS